MSKIEFHDSRGRLSETLREVSRALPKDRVTLRTLLVLIGEQGLLLACVFLTLPFLIPVSVPGVSTIFGLAIILFGIGVTFNRVPWLPRRILDRPFASGALSEAFEKGARFAERFEHWLRPRWHFLTRTRAVNVAHGVALTFAGALLMALLGLVPFSNTLPALAVLGLALGMLERDGLLIAVGYALNVATLLYFSVLFAGALAAGHGLLGLIR